MTTTSDVVSVGRFLGEARYVPASVQRTFQWGQDQTETLLNDLLRAWRATTASTEADELDCEMGPSPAETDLEAGAFEDEALAELSVTENVAQVASEYFLGPIVLQRDDAQRLTIYDGLQRTASLIVLFSVLRDLVTDDFPDAADVLHNCVCASDGKPRLQLLTGDRTLTEKIVAKGEAVRSRRYVDYDGVNRNILQAARIFRVQIGRLTAAEQASFADFIYARIQVCRIFTTRTDVARQIFVTTNDRGLRLNQTDVFKSQIASVATSDEASARFIELWRKITNALEGTGLQNYLNAVFVLSQKKWPSAQGLTAMGDHIIANFSEPRLFEWLTHLYEWIDDWKFLFGVRDPTTKDSLKGDLRRLQIFKWEEWHPLALYYARRYRKVRRDGATRSVGILEQRFNFLHKRCMAFTLAEVGEDARRRIFLSALRQELQRRNPNSARNAFAITDTQKSRIRQVLNRPITDRRTYTSLIRWYEMLLWEDNPPSHVLAATAEHILPQKPDPNSQWGKDFPDEMERGDLAYSLGNLTLLSWKDNGEAGRGNFLAKKTIYARSEHRLLSLEQVCTQKEWTADVIRRRCSFMAEQISRELDVVEN